MPVRGGALESVLAGITIEVVATLYESDIVPKRRPKKATKKPTSATIAKSNGIIDSLRKHFERGKRANEENMEDGKITTVVLASIKGVNEYTLRKDRDFAEHFLEEELNELCRLRRENGLPLHWGYVPTLLSAGSKTKRRKFSAWPYGKT